MPKQTGYVRQVVQAMGWTLDLDAQGGTGYTKDGSRTNFSPMPARLPRDNLRYSPDVVIVDGGRHDLAGSQTAQVVRQYFNRINRYWPGATVYLVVPFEVSAPDIRAAAPWWHRWYTKLAASRPNTFVVDPNVEEWFATDGSELANKMPGTNAHPNQAGHDVIAGRFLDLFAPASDPTDPPATTGDPSCAPTTDPTATEPVATDPTTTAPTTPATTDPTTPTSTDPTTPATSEPVTSEPVTSDPAGSAMVSCSTG